MSKNRPAPDSTTETRTAAGRIVADDMPLVDASTIMLLRDAAGGVEVLLLERHLQSDFAGGALVFPGGKVDASDRNLPRAFWDGRDPAEWRELLGAASDAVALGLMVAAVRETFEEANILLATRDGKRLTDADLRRASFVDARRRLGTRGEAFNWHEWLAAEGLVLDFSALAPWSWWVTPKGSHRRFDTRFFVACVPPGQSGASDTMETTDMRWSTAEAALRAHEKEEAVVIFPTRRNLSGLAAYTSAQKAWAAADAGDVGLHRIEPHIVHVDGRIMVQHPEENEPDAI